MAPAQVAAQGHEAIVDGGDGRNVAAAGPQGRVFLPHERLVAGAHEADAAHGFAVQVTLCILDALVEAHRVAIAADFAGVCRHAL